MQIICTFIAKTKINLQLIGRLQATITMYSKHSSPIFKERNHTHKEQANYSDTQLK